MKKRGPKKSVLSRRRFLQSSSTILSLPFLESLAWREARAATIVRPLKVGFFMYPMGNHVDVNNNCMLEGGRSWMTPDLANGQLDFTKRVALQPLNSFKSELIFPLRFYIRDDQMNDSPHGGTGQFLTVAGFNNQPFYPSNYERNVRSIDQYISTKLGLNRLNLEHLNMVGIEAYQMKPYIDGSEQQSKANVYASWKCLDVNGNQDLQAADEQIESQPKDIFNKLFPNSMSNVTSAEELKNRRKKSILDSLVTDLSGLRVKLGSADKIQLDRYTASVRDLEKSITDTPTTPTCSLNPQNTFGTSGGYGDYDSGSPNKGGVKYIAHTKQMMEVLALGMACDHVKLATYVLDNKFYGRKFQMLYNIDIHAASHLDGSFGTEGLTLTQLAQEYRAYRALHVSMFAHLLQKLTESGSLDSSLLVFGSGMNMFRNNNGASNHHSEDLPIILAGKANGKVTPGKTVDLGKKVRLGTLWQKIHQIATGADVDLGKSLGGYYANKDALIFNRSDNIDIPL